VINYIRLKAKELWNKLSIWVEKVKAYIAIYFNKRKLDNLFERVLSECDSTNFKSKLDPSDMKKIGDKLRGYRCFNKISIDVIAEAHYQNTENIKYIYDNIYSIIRYLANNRIEYVKNKLNKLNGISFTDYYKNITYTLVVNNNKIKIENKPICANKKDSYEIAPITLKNIKDMRLIYNSDISRSDEMVIIKNTIKIQTSILIDINDWEDELLKAIKDKKDNVEDIRELLNLTRDILLNLFPKMVTTSMNMLLILYHIPIKEWIEASCNKKI